MSYSVACSSECSNRITSCHRHTDCACGAWSFLRVATSACVVLRAQAKNHVFELARRRGQGAMRHQLCKTVEVLCRCSTLSECDLTLRRGIDRLHEHQRHNQRFGAEQLHLEAILRLKVDKDGEKSNSSSSDLYGKRSAPVYTPCFNTSGLVNSVRKSLVCLGCQLWLASHELFSVSLIIADCQQAVVRLTSTQVGKRKIVLADLVVLYGPGCLARTLL